MDAVPEGEPVADCCTVTVEPLIAVTLPTTNPPKPPRAAPLGMPDGAEPDGKLLGIPDGAPLGRVPPPKPLVHVPVDDGELTRTVAAVIGPVVEADDEPDDDDALVATTQEPTLTADTVAAEVRVNFVDEP